MCLAVCFPPFSAFIANSSSVTSHITSVDNDEHFFWCGVSSGVRGSGDVASASKKLYIIKEKLWLFVRQLAAENGNGLKFYTVFSIKILVAFGMMMGGRGWRMESEGMFSHYILISSFLLNN